MTERRHPLFARCLARSAAIAERKGADVLRRRLVEGLAGRGGEVDAGVCAGVLCSVDDPAAALRELARVIRPDGELRFFEHVASSRPRAAALQRALDASGLWRRAMGGCHTARPSDTAIAAAGFAIERL